MPHTIVYSPSGLLQSDPVTRGWFLLAMVSLGFGSLMAVVLVAAKTPLVAHLPFFAEHFADALVYHVNLSTLFWVQAMLGVILGLLPCANLLIDRCSLWLSWFALGAMLFSFALPGEVVFSNYVPVKLNALFFVALGLLQLALALRIVNRTACFRTGVELPVYAHLLLGCVVGWVLAISAFGVALAWGHATAEVLFWGAGHLLQLQNVLLLMSCLALLTPAVRIPLAAYWLYLLLSAVFVTVLLFHDPATAAYREAFTIWMCFFSLPIVPLVMRPLFLQGTRWVRICLMFLVLGGGVGALIRSDNLLVPAHYHAMMGALNLGLMGFCYQLLAQSEHASFPSRLRAFYALGVVLLVAGFAGAGWWGIGRKLVSGGMSSGDGTLGLWLLALGGGLALLAMVFFVLFALHRWFCLIRLGRGRLCPQEAL